MQALYDGLYASDICYWRNKRDNTVGNKNGKGLSHPLLRYIFDAVDYCWAELEFSDKLCKKAAYTNSLVRFPWAPCKQNLPHHALLSLHT